LIGFGWRLDDPAMNSIHDLLLETDWAALEHAYSQASETPSHLLALVGDDAQARSDAVGFLNSAILHQGTPYSATAPAARVVALLLSDPRTAELVEDVFPWRPEPQPLRLALLDFLAGVAEACTFSIPHQELLATAYPVDRHEAELQRLDHDRRAAMAELGPDPATRLLVDKVELPAGLRAAYEDEHYQEAMAARDVLACREITGELLQQVSPFLDDADEQVRASALQVVVAILASPGLASGRPALIRRLETVAATGSLSVRERATVAIMLGRLGARPLGLLADAHPAVRACAALTPAMAADPRATRELLIALADPQTADAWFDKPLPGLDGRFRFALVEAAVGRVKDFAELLPAALAVVPLASSYTVASDWGPLLQAAFPQPYDQGRPLSPAQRSFLAALVDHDALWEGVANPDLWLMRAGLPQDRDDCRQLLDLGDSAPADADQDSSQDSSSRRDPGSSRHTNTP
jgi:hypothetical protein